MVIISVIIKMCLLKDSPINSIFFIFIAPNWFDFFLLQKETKSTIYSAASVEQFA